MKSIILLIMMPLSIYAQKDSKTSELLWKYGNAKLEYVESRGDKSYNYLSLTFQNMKYQSIVDVGVVLFMDIDKAEMFTKQLSEACESAGTGSYTTWHPHEGVKISVSAKGKIITITDINDSEGEKFFWLSKKKAYQLIESIETNSFRIK